MISKVEKETIIKKFGKDKNDTGNTKVQVAILTYEIKQLTEHFKTHKKDFHSKLGLYKKVSKRSSLLKYLKNNNFDIYQSLIKELGLRK